MPKSKEFTALTEEVVMNQIYVIRNQKVMLDRDLAKLYAVETKVLKQQVRRNIERFPEDFMFEMTETELQNWRSQFVTSNSPDLMGLRYAPFCFTEQGVAMLSGVINSAKAIAMNIAIMRAFVAIRKLSLTNKLMIEKLQKLEDKIDSHDVQLNQIYDAIENLLDDKSEKESIPKTRKRIGFKPDDL